MTAILPITYLLLSLVPLIHASNNPVAVDFDCSSYNPQFKPGCLLHHETNPDKYNVCKKETCYLFLQGPPFITIDAQKIFNDSAAALIHQTPFRCGDFAQAFPTMSGISFEIHKRTSSRDAYCIWAGHPNNCTFNQLVDYTQIKANQGFRYAITGALLQTPQRQCHHTAGAAIVDNSMIIIGQKNTTHKHVQGVWEQLTRPFAWQTWLIFIAVIFLFLLVCISIAVRFRISKSKSMITAFFIFSGDRNEALAHETYLRGNNQESAQQTMSLATKYGLSMTLYRMALLSFVGIFLLFYEAAVVNFLFQQQALSLKTKVKDLTQLDLKKFAVLKDSALENVWNATVNQEVVDGGKPPWYQCDAAVQCIQAAESNKKPPDADTPVEFAVTFDVVGKYLLKTVSDCDKLTIFETKDNLYQFNAGMLYNDMVDDAFRQQVDRELVALRINGTLRRLVEEEVGDFSCTSSEKSDIGPKIILIPCLLLVIPPLLASIVVLLLWKCGQGDSKRNNRSVDATVNDQTLSPGDMTAVTAQDSKAPVSWSSAFRSSISMRSVDIR